MKATERLSYQAIVFVALSALSIAAALSLFWLDARHKAVPLQPAPVANRSEQAAVQEETAAAKLLQLKSHTVAEGETLSQIAEMYQIDVDTIYGANQQLTDIIHPGDVLTILPRSGVLHTVSEGETLWSIGIQYGVNSAEISSVNQKNGDLLSIGEKLFIPGGKLIRSEAPSRAGASRFLWPLLGELSSGFGYRWGRMHAGIDIAADMAAPVSAARAGYISFSGWLGSYGYAVVIEHNQGYSTLYGHLSEYTVAKGEYIAAGSLLGYVGSTGFSTGPHLHFEIRYYGTPVNPLGLLP